jgi:hypothetical protein
VEGYAHTGRWSHALEQSTAAFRVSKQYVGPLLCTLWARIQRQTAASPERAQAISQVQNMFRCIKE